MPRGSSTREDFRSMLMLDDHADRGVSFDHGNGCRHRCPVAPLDGQRWRYAPDEGVGPDPVLQMRDANAGRAGRHRGTPRLRLFAGRQAGALSDGRVRRVYLLSGVANLWPRMGDAPARPAADEGVRGTAACPDGVELIARLRKRYRLNLDPAPKRWVEGGRSASSSGAAVLAQRGRGGLDARSGAFTVDERGGEGGRSPREAQA